MNGLVVRPLPLVLLQGYSNAAGGINAAFPLAALADPQPKVVLQTATATPRVELRVDVDLGADIAFDTVAVLFANASSTARWKCYASPAASGFGVINGAAPPSAQLVFGQTDWTAYQPATTKVTRLHGLASGAPIVARYLRFFLEDYAATNAEQLIRLGLIMVGNNVVPTSTYDGNFELGSMRRVFDLSQVEQLPGGEFNRDRRAKPAGFKATWSNIGMAEARALWAALAELGESEPMLLVEDPAQTAGLQERIHYGVLRGLDWLVRTQDIKQQIALEVRDWL